MGKESLVTTACPREPGDQANTNLLKSMLVSMKHFQLSVSRGERSDIPNTHCMCVCVCVQCEGVCTYARIIKSGLFKRGPTER